MGVYIWKERLPSTYQEVEYIQSSGSQYIDTGFKPTGNSELEFDFNIYDSSSAYGLFGVDSGWTVNAFSVFRDRILCYGNQYQSESLYFDIGTRYKLEFKNLTCYLNGSQRFTYTQQSFTSNYSAYLFAKRRNNSIEMYGKVRVFGLKLRDSGVLVRDFVPCYRKSDDEIGMYDLVNNQFYTNSGSGIFTKGPDINYIEHELKNAYIGKYGWEPGDNTIAYYPLTADLKDSISGNTPYSTKGSFSYDGKSCRVNNGAMYWNLGKNMDFTQPFTIFQRLNPSSRRSYSSRLGYPMQNNSSIGGFEVWQTGTSTNSSVARFQFVEGSGSWGASNGWEMPLNEWHCFVIVYTGSQLLVYRDKVVMDYSQAMNISSGGGFHPTGTATVMRFSVNNNYDYYDGYVAHLGVEDRAWSQSDVDIFYKSIKELMQLS